MTVLSKVIFLAMFQGVYGPHFNWRLSRDKDGCTPNVRVPMVFIVFNLGILVDYNYNP